MSEDTVDRLQALELSALAEVVQSVLPDLVGIDEPETAAARVAALASLPEAAAGEMEALAQQTGRDVPSELQRVLRAVLGDIAESSTKEAAHVSAAIGNAGHKLIVVGPELYALCTLLLCGYVAARTGGKKNETREVEVREAADGRVELRIRHRIEYLNPFGPLAGLLKRVLHVSIEPPGDQDTKV